MESCQERIDEIFDMAMPIATHSALWTLALDEVTAAGVIAGAGTGTSTGASDGNVCIYSRPVHDTSLNTGANFDGKGEICSADESNWSSGTSTPSLPCALAMPSDGMINRVCANCRTNQTPFWRRAGEGRFYCNACGLYLRAHKRMRPLSLQVSRQTKKIRNRVDMCSNCSAKDTPLWRRLASGETVCNACGLYYKLHGAHRPIGDQRQLIQTNRKQRTILPKYASGDGWRHYYPPGSNENGDQISADHEEDVGSLHLSKEQQRTLEIMCGQSQGGYCYDYVQFMVMNSAYNSVFNMLPSFANPLASPFEPQVPNKLIHQAELGNLDESIQWASNSPSPCPSPVASNSTVSL